MSDISAKLVKDLRAKTGAGMMDCKKALSESDGDFSAAEDFLRKKGLSSAARKSGRVASDGLVGFAVRGNCGAMVEVNSETDFVARNDVFQKFVGRLSAIALEHADNDSLLAADYGSGVSVREQLTHMMATIGENIKLRRVGLLVVEQGVIGSYMHNSASDAVGKIGVLVALEGANADVELAKGLAMHIAAARPRFLSIAEVDSDTLRREREILTEQAKASGKPADVIVKMVEGRLRKFYQESVLLEQTYVIDGESAIKKVLGDNRISSFVRFELGEGLEKKQEDFAAEVASVAQSV